VIVALATTNPGKVRELAALLAPTVELVPAPAAYQAPDETGESYLENARLKARALASLVDGDALADDSGLEVNGLGGRPGVRSSRYGATASERNARLLEELRGRVGEARRARFRTVLVLVRADGSEIAAEGTCDGVIAFEPRGENGFGYDPLFLVPDLGRTFAELASDEKDRRSARAVAARALVARLVSATSGRDLGRSRG
jgi:XTP/dITP diphosphohydrolase